MENASRVAGGFSAEIALVDKEDIISCRGQMLGRRAAVYSGADDGHVKNPQTDLGEGFSQLPILFQSDTAIIVMVTAS